MSQVPSFIFGCPGCQKEFKVLAEFSGEVVQCPHCGQKMRIPADFFKSLDESRESADLGISQQKKVEEKISSSRLKDEAAKLSSEAEKPKAKQALKPQRREKPPVSGTEQPSSTSNSREASSDKSVKKEEAKKPEGRKKVFESQPSESGSIKPESIVESPAVTEVIPSLVEPGQFKLPPTFSSGLEASPALEKSKNSLPTHPDLPPVFLAGGDKSETASSRSQVSDSAQQNGSGGQQVELDPAIVARLPPRFEADDPTKIRTNREASTKVFLPTAEGGIQTLDQRTVTVEYQGQKYVLIAMSAEEKRRRVIISNIVSILIAVLAIALTLWILN